MSKQLQQQSRNMPAYPMFQGYNGVPPQPQTPYSFNAPQMFPSSSVPDIPTEAVSNLNITFDRPPMPQNYNNRYPGSVPPQPNGSHPLTMQSVHPGMFMTSPQTAVQPAKPVPQGIMTASSEAFVPSQNGVPHLVQHSPQSAMPVHTAPASVMPPPQSAIITNTAPVPVIPTHTAPAPTIPSHAVPAPSPPPQISQEPDDVPMAPATPKILESRRCKKLSSMHKYLNDGSTVALSANALALFTQKLTTAEELGMDAEIAANLDVKKFVLIYETDVVSTNTALKIYGRTINNEVINAIADDIIVSDDCGSTNITIVTKNSLMLTIDLETDTSAFILYENTHKTEELTDDDCIMIPIGTTRIAFRNN